MKYEDKYKQAVIDGFYALEEGRNVIIRNGENRQLIQDIVDFYKMQHPNIKNRCDLRISDYGDEKDMIIHIIVNGLELNGDIEGRWEDKP